MRTTSPGTRVIIVGGTSNVGKTTLARALAARLNWSHISTDSLARHPGRPWQAWPEKVPEHVAAYYLTYQVDYLITDVLHHYENLWPQIEALITAYATDRARDGLILEGSALWPESVATIMLENVKAFWLTADDRLFQTRIFEASNFERATDRERIMIQRFLDRTLRYNDQMMEVVNRLGLISLDVEEASSVDELCDVCLKIIDD